MDNGAKKGGSIPTLDTISKAPGLETLWQLHYSDEGGSAHNTSERYIANIQGTDEGHSLELTASKDGSFEVLNSRTKFLQKYPRRR
jgi:competence protein ComEC